MRTRIPGRRPGASVFSIAAGVAIAAVHMLTGAASGDQGNAKDRDKAGHRPLQVKMASRWQDRPPAEFGFSDSGPGFLKASEGAVAAGSTIARFPVSWTNIMEHGFRNLNRVVSLLEASGITPLLTVADAPPWTSPEAYVNGQFYIRAPDPAFDGQFAAFYAELARRYPDAVLQVWSEPNLEFYGKIPPDRYVELAELAAATVHAINPEQTVIGAAPSPGDDAWRQYLRAVYSSLDPSIDIGINLYPRKGRSVTRALRRLSKDYRRVQKIARGRPIWVTETGLASIQFGVMRQARGSARIYKILAGGNAKAIIFHRLIDPDYGINEWEDSLGALTVDEQPKPLFEKLRRLRQRHLDLSG